MARRVITVRSRAIDQRIDDERGTPDVAERVG
jgi:hypothetical protein